MSTGGIIGGVLGGVAGFIFGGPLGALYGAGMGMAVGTFIDPMVPDIPAIGVPSTDKQVMTSTIGIPIPDVVGTSKIVGQLLCYGNERAVLDAVANKHKYYMSWVIGICSGPIHTLYSIYKEEELAWEGELTIADTTNGQVTIPIDGMGTCEFYFGTSDHVQNSDIGALLAHEDLNTPYKNLCYVFFNDCYIGGLNRAPTMKFMFSKFPTTSLGSGGIIQTYDYNPIHAMWYMLHNLIGIPEEWLNSTKFSSVSSVLAAETRGVSVLLDKQQEAKVYLESLNNHTDTILIYGSDGKLFPKVIRKNYEESTLPLVDENVMLESPTFNRRSWNDVVNEVQVQYTKIVDVVSEEE